jgi:glycosyltransferase involved in cell wall biosynthesis
VAAKRVKLIYNGIDLDASKTQDPRPKGQIKKELGLGEGPVIGIVARLSEVKGHRFLVSALKRALNEMPDLQLFIVGDGKEKESLLVQARQLGIEKKVFFISSVEDTAKVLSAMDLFVLPSLQEGLGLSLMEAMAQGVPIIASDVGGIRSLIQDGVTGKLVKPQDIEGLEKAILELLQDKPKASAYAQSAFKSVKNNFSLEKMVVETERVYLECLGAGY